MPRGKKSKTAKAKKPVVAKASAPVAEKAKKAGKRGPRASKEHIQTILKKVDELKQGGLTITKALKDVGVSYPTFNNWVKKYGSAGTKATSGKKAGKGQSTKADMMKVLLDEIAVLREAGTALAKAAKEKGVSVANYYYWVKRLGGETPVKTAKVAKVASAKKPAEVGKAKGLAGLLEAMTRNRAEREKLDAEWSELKKRFEKEG